MKFFVAFATQQIRQTVVAASLVSLLLVGCGKSDPKGTVQGKVLLEDKPYTDAAVVLLSPSTGQGGSANIEADGTFKLPSPLPVGTYTVYLNPKIVDSPDPVPVKVDRSVPQKYWNESSSDIRAEVVEGDNEVTVNLQKK